MRDGGDNSKDAGPNLFGENDWRIGTGYTKKNQSSKSNQFEYRIPYERVNIRI
jgi:hypothetical protein